MAAHDMIFFEKRSTAKVVPKGKSFTAPPSYGKQTRRRPATPAEEKKIAAGEWVDTDQSGKKSGEAGRKKTKLRPALLKQKSAAELLPELREKYGRKDV